MAWMWGFHLSELPNVWMTATIPGRTVVSSTTDAIIADGFVGEPRHIAQKLSVVCGAGNRAVASWGWKRPTGRGDVGEDLMLVVDQLIQRARTRIPRAIRGRTDVPIGNDRRCRRHGAHSG
jgi:hypothetical protein